ncbi:MAG: CPBP family intramembrane metalloprotease [Actinobacteria bacterium]|nr:CPBP family intramembrane metalloprotease [Actinomycetota bacterium]
MAWPTLALVFAVRFVNPLDGPLGEEPGWRGYALPQLQARRAPLEAALILGLFVALWHVPMVMTGQLAAIGLVVTFAITVVYVWLFNHTGGSVLMTMLFHIVQGTVSYAALGVGMAPTKTPAHGLAEAPPPLLRRRMVAPGWKGRIVQPRSGNHHALPPPGNNDPLAVAQHDLRTTPAPRDLWRAGCGANPHVRFGRAAWRNGPEVIPAPRSRPTPPGSVPVTTT